MERWNRHARHNGTPRSLRETPLLVLGGVAIFVVWAVVFSSFLLEDDEPETTSGVAAEQSAATATASPTPSATALAVASTSEGGNTQPSVAASIATPTPSTADPVSAESTVAPDSPTQSAAQATLQGTQPAQADEETLAVLVELLPTLDDLPDGFVVTNEGSLALDELAALHPDPDTQRVRLRDWGFTGAIERQFEIADGSDTSQVGMTLLTTLVVEFRTPDDARAAVEASHADAQSAEGADISSVEIEPLGDFARAASGTLTVNGEPLHVAYVIVQLGNRAITFAGGAPAEDPLAEVIEVASATLNSL